ncbi:protein lin-37 homolog [Nilaparvata lugens]|uniref:protein lin-37 homolog n=1 Tax=Nilaparvata lugens TaxID=108931 RepID=UPI000B9951E8|nr:protein lin-37 homolog [Nilaparvata lugens]
MVKIKKRRTAKSGQDGKETSDEMRIVAARDRLKGALQDLIDHSDDDSSSSQDDRTPVSPKSPKKDSRQTVRRRKKKEVDVDQQFHHTFVMKLFDRSVDLAQFGDETPLYPICRAWMANQPIPSIKTEPEDVPEEAKDESMAEPKENDDVVDLENIKDVYKMPPPVGPPLSRIPSPERVELQGITDETFQMNTNKGVLLNEHMERWMRVRRKWQKAAQDNEARYAESGKILTAIYKKALKAYQQ